MPIYYLYRHIRQDLDIPFYIGMAEVNKMPRFNTNIQYYNRAYATGKCARNHFWFDIAKKTDFDVEIMCESENQNEIAQKEFEFIKLYGRIFDNSGSLANINPGGIRCSTLERHSRLKLGKPVYVYTVSGRFVAKYDILRDAAKELNLSLSIVCAALKGRKNASSNKYVFFDNYQGSSISSVKYEKNAGRPILAIEVASGDLIREIPTYSAFKKEFKIHQRDAYEILNNGGSIVGVKYIFKDLLNGFAGSV